MRFWNGFHLSISLAMVWRRFLLVNFFVTVWDMEPSNLHSTQDILLQFKEENCSAEREEPESVCNYHYQLHFHSISTKSTTCSDSRWGWNACCRWRWKKYWPRHLFRRNWRGSCLWLRRWDSCLQRLQTFSCGCALPWTQASDWRALFPCEFPALKVWWCVCKKLVPAEIQDTEFNMSHDANASVVKNLVTDETFG